MIGNWPEPPHRMHLSMLLEDEIVCLLRGATPSPAKRRRPTTTSVPPTSCRCPTISQRGVIDTVLAASRISRDERVVVQSFSAAPYLLHDTDLVFTTTRHFAHYYADLLPLAILPSPIPFPADALLPSSGTNATTSRPPTAGYGGCSATAGGR